LFRVALRRSFFFREAFLEDGEHKLEIPSARPEFRELHATEVWKAVGGGNPDVNPVVAEVTRLAVAYLAAFKSHADQYGNAPPTLPLRVRWPIEKVAVLLVVKFMEAEGGAALPFTLQ
jgi:hypothetical protein